MRVAGFPGKPSDGGSVVAVVVLAVAKEVSKGGMVLRPSERGSSGWGRGTGWSTRILRGGGGWTLFLDRGNSKYK